MSFNETQADALTRIAEEGLPGVAAEMARLRSEVRLAQRSWRFMLVAFAVAVCTVAAVFWQQHQDDVRDGQADRRYELDQCERGNSSREVIAEAINTQTEALIAASAPADGVVTDHRQQAVALYRSRVDPIVAELRKDRDCVALLEKAAK